MRIQRNTAGNTSLEWAVLGVMTLGMLVPLTFVGSAAIGRVGGANALPPVASRATEASFVSVPPPRIDRATTDDPQHDAGGAEPGFLDRALAFASALLGATAESFEDAALALVPSMLELVDAGERMLAHESRALAQDGIGAYASSRLSIATTLGGIAAKGVLTALLDPMKTVQVALNHANAYQQRIAGHVAAIRSAGLSPVALGHVLGPILFDMLLDRMIPGPSTPHAPHVPRSNSLLSNVRDAVLHHANDIEDLPRVAAAIPFLPPMRGVASQRWPHLFDANGRVRVPTSHKQLLWRFAEEGDDELLDGLNGSAAVLGRSQRGHRTEAEWVDFNRDRFDLILHQEYGSRLIANAPEPYQRAIEGDLAPLWRALFRHPTARELRLWTGRTSFDLPSGGSLLDYTAGREMLAAVQHVLFLERRVAVAAAGQAQAHLRAPYLFDEYKQSTKLIRDLTTRLEAVELYALTAQATVRRAPGTVIPDDLLAISNSADFLHIMKVQDGSVWLEQHSAGRTAFARRLAELGHQERIQISGGQAVIEGLQKAKRSIAVYVRNDWSEADVHKKYRAWQGGSDKTVYILEDGVPPPSGVRVPESAAVLDTFLADERSIFEFLQLFY